MRSSMIRSMLHPRRDEGVRFPLTTGSRVWGRPPYGFGRALQPAPGRAERQTRHHHHRRCTSTSALQANFRSLTGRFRHAERRPRRPPSPAREAPLSRRRAAAAPRIPRRAARLSKGRDRAAAIGSATSAGHLRPVGQSCSGEPAAAPGRPRRDLRLRVMNLRLFTRPLHIFENEEASKQNPKAPNVGVYAAIRRSQPRR